MNQPNTLGVLGRVADDDRAGASRTGGNRPCHAHGDSDRVTPVLGVRMTGIHDERTGSSADRRQTECPSPS